MLDADVVLYAAAGMESTATETLYRLHRQKVFHLCLRLGCGNRAWAEDVTHDVFVKLLRELPSLHDRGALGGWIYRVTVNTCLKRLRRDGAVWQRVRCALQGLPPPQRRDPEQRVQLKQELQTVLGQLERLTPRERAVFCMRFLDGHSQQEIAGALSLSVGYVSKLLARAREKLVAAGWEVANA